MLPALSGFKPALNSKGLRRCRGCSYSLKKLQASPEFKGIKTALPSSVRRFWGFKPALNSKGLRPPAWLPLWNSIGLQASPEFKGIKTWPCSNVSRIPRLQASPEFKGIKTSLLPPAGLPLGFKPALNSKGLRPLYPGRIRQGGTRFKPALNSKGLRLIKLPGCQSFRASSQP